MYVFTFFLVNDSSTTEIYTLSLHDALPILPPSSIAKPSPWVLTATISPLRSEEHTSELQSRLHLVCRLLLEKKNNNTKTRYRPIHIQKAIRTLKEPRPN